MVQTEDKHVASSHPEDAPAQMREKALKINEWPRGQCVIILHAAHFWSRPDVLLAWWCHLDALFVKQGRGCSLLKAFNDVSARYKVEGDEKQTVTRSLAPQLAPSGSSQGINSL